LKPIPAERVCKSCLANKPISEFHFYTPESPSYKCKECHTQHERARQKALWANNPEYRERHNEFGRLYRKGEKPSKISEGRASTKICCVCSIEKQLDEFPSRGNYRLKTCNLCYKDKENNKARFRYHSDPDYKTRKYLSATKARLKFRYNVTIEEVLETLQLQHNKCANNACGVEISLTAPKELVKPAVIDHDHNTGKFRALLCSRCNTLLGHLEKSKPVVDGLFEYSNRFKP